jgi:hypothetical protein
MAAIALGALAILLGAVASYREASNRSRLKALYFRLRETHKSTSITSAAITPSPSQVARERVLSRINEASSYRSQEHSASNWSKRASALLTTAQYIFGGVLASSFIQESLTPKWVGGLGVLVLIASLVRQQFHPEINAEDAHKKASQLEALIRSSEDQLAILDARIAAGQDHTDAMISLMTQITQTLTEIENPEGIQPKGTT